MARRTTLEVDSRELVVLPTADDRDLGSEGAAAIVDQALSHGPGREDLARWLGTPIELLDDPEVRTRAIELLTSGWVAIQLDDADLGAEELDPWTDPIEPVHPVRPSRVRPTWIEIVVIDERGRAVAASQWSLTLPDGSVRRVVLDASSRWRADDVLESGSCHLRARASTRERGSVIAEWRGIEADDVWLSDDLEHTAMLATGRSHRLVLVEGETEIVLVDDAEQPIAGASCHVRVGERVLRGTTDLAGLFVARHPAAERDIEVTFPEIDADAYRLLRSEPIAVEPGV